MTDERTKRALMRGDIIELSLGLGYVAVHDSDAWAILEGAADILDDEPVYDGDDESVHSALLHEARRHLKNVDRLRAVVDAQPAPQSNPPESYVGRVYAPTGDRTPAYICEQMGQVLLIVVHEDGTRYPAPRTDVDSWTHLSDHPMATDPPREDGLGWQEGDQYDMRGECTVAKLRGGGVNCHGRGERRPGFGAPRSPILVAPDLHAAVGGRRARDVRG